MTVIVSIAAAILVCSCGPGKIRKEPISREDEILSIRLMAAGDELLNEGKDHLAMLKYLEASRVNPYHEVIFNRLAVTYSRLHMYYQARQAVERSIRLNPEYAYAYNTQGTIDLVDARTRSAVQSFEKAIDLDQEVASFHLNLGYALVQDGKVEEARRAYSRAFELNPNILDADFLELSFSSRLPMDPEKFYSLAVVFADLGNLGVAIQYLEKAISIGFTDYPRIRGEPSFRKYQNEPEFVSFLQRYGILG
jgi:tetratricopeptide (TPR) repeat protein